LAASRLIAPVIALVLVLGLVACGGDSGSGSATTASQGANAGRNFLADPKVQACLKKQGVTVPSGRRPNGGNGQPPGDGSGQPPAGGNGQPPAGGNEQPPAGGNGQPPTATNGRPPGAQRNSAQFQKLRAALQKCGVTFPNRGNGAPPPSQDTTTTSAS
jgi:hypothetical protein